VARIDRRRLEGAAFPVTTTIQTRFDDIDAQGHVNNAAAAVILQEARVALNHAARAQELSPDLRPVVAALSIEYAGEMYHPNSIEVSTGILAVGRSSVTVGQMARQGDHITLYAETVLVMLDSAGPAAMPDDLRAAYEGLLIRPRLTL
jgi:acyl-CoA thioester hydrolase